MPGHGHPEFLLGPLAAAAADHQPGRKHVIERRELEATAGVKEEAEVLGVAINGAGQGVECRQLMSDNGPAYLSRRFAKACKALGLKHIRTRPYTPRTNGKAERFIQTLCKEWAYSMPFQNSVERNLWLPRYLSIYNRLRKHSALGGRSPQQRLDELLC